MKARTARCLLAAAALCCLTTAAQAQLADYSQDFEGLDINSATALSADGWKIFGNVFDPGGGYLYGYGVFDAPNGTGAFSNVTDAAGGAPVGNQGLVVFSDYNSGEHNNGNLIEANVFQEQSIAAADVGMDYVFSFVAAPGDLQDPTTALAFIKTLDPNNGHAQTNFLTIDTSSLPAGNSSYTIPISIDAGLVGQLLQFGFASTATNFDASGVNYDNVSFSKTVPEPSAAVLGLAGLLGLAGVLRRRG